MIIEEDFVSDRGRRRRRPVRVDLDEVRRGLDAPSARDLDVWQQVRVQLERRVGESTYAIWLEPIELIAVDGDQRLVVVAPAATTGWTSKRFGRLLAAVTSELGRNVRFATEPERHAFVASARFEPIPINQKEASR